MNPRLLCVLAGSVLLAGCGATAASSPHPTSVPATPASPSTSAANPTATAPAAPTSPTQISSNTDPKNAYKAGITELQGHNYAAAAKHFQQAITAHHHVADAYAGLGNADLRLGKYAAGYHAYVTAARMAPANANAVYGAALGAYTSKQFVDSIRYATEYIHLRPRVAAGYHLRMLAYDSLAKPKPQLADAAAIARLEPHDAQAYNDLGIAYGNNQKYKQSLAAFARAISLEGTNYSFYFNRAVIENIMKRRSAALKDMSKAQALAPTSRTKKAIAAVKQRMKQGK
jgi:tetratricopeptide (TPR) repeat protein